MPQELSGFAIRKATAASPNSICRRYPRQAGRYGTFVAVTAPCQAPYRVALSAVVITGHQLLPFISLSPPTGVDTWGRPGRSNPRFIFPCHLWRRDISDELASAYKTSRLDGNRPQTVDLAAGAQYLSVGYCRFVAYGHHT